MAGEPTGLSIRWHDPRDARPPAGWEEFVAARRLPDLWRWAPLRAAATVSRPAVLAATVRDGGDRADGGGTVRGLVTARFPGPRAAGRGTIPLAGVVDVDHLLSPSLPGLVTDEPAAHQEAVAALRLAVRARWGWRAGGLMFRQVAAGELPAVTRWPAVVREGGPIAVFRNTHADFDSYVRTLGRTRRQWLLRRMREIDADEGITVTRCAPGAAGRDIAPEELCALVNRTVHKHHHTRLLRKRLTRPEVAGALLAGPEARVTAYRDRAGRLLAAGMITGPGPMPVYNAWGALGPEEGGRDGLWFYDNMLKVRWCIENGFDGFLSGMGTIPAKRSLRYEMRRQWAVLLPLPPCRRG
ncbi:hypothetical protein Sru01_34590 [Sphaerisporangium rufum]|uniref:Uncharacterized protein n=1 Tax=Sphaerisporangium rufum TaxID=1381558 RepID=A0A919V1D5_9ACTN|nr:hypothetical protein [Sphaerisporangium rufum]GII78477.1 hypothetical protein Sru01_34590 [Sphaerisporangium rufum]